MAGSKKARKDNRGRLLRTGESYVAEKSIYKYRFTDFLGQRHTIYDKDLLSLRKKEEALQFFVDNYEKYREIYLPTMLKYYQDLRSCLGYDEEYEVDGYPYITTIDQLLETIEFTGMIVHDDKKDGKHAIGLFLMLPGKKNMVQVYLWQALMSLIQEIRIMHIILMRCINLKE